MSPEPSPAARLAERLAALTPAQRALFERLKPAAAAPPAAGPPPVRQVSGSLGLGDWPLTVDQRRLWRMHRRDPNLVSWNVDAGSVVHGRLDLPRFRAAIDVLVRRHAAWRTVFPALDGEPLQRVVAYLAPELALVDLRGLPAPCRRPEGEDAILRHTRRPFDLARGPLLRLALVRLEEDRHLFLLTIHHLVTDWISFQVFFAELMALYEHLGTDPAAIASASVDTPTGAALGEPPAQFPDFAVWERDWLQGEAVAADAEFWRRELAGFPLALDLPADRPRPAVQSQRGGLCRLRAGAERSERLRGLARREGATPFIGVLALLYVLLWRLTGRARLVVGSNSANRLRPEVQATAGFFLTQVPFAADLQGDPSFREVLARSRRTALAAYAHQNLPFSRLIEALRGGGADLDAEDHRHPIVQVMLLVLEPQTAARAGGLEFEPIGLYDGNSRWDLLFGLYDQPEAGLLGVVEYNADILDGATVDGWLDRLYALWDAVTADPDAPLSAISERADGLERAAPADVTGHAGQEAGR